MGLEQWSNTAPRDRPLQWMGGRSSWHPSDLLADSLHSLDTAADKRKYGKHGMSHEDFMRAIGDGSQHPWRSISSRRSRAWWAAINSSGERSDLGFTQWGAKRDLDARLGESVKPWTLHDLRRTAATGMADIGVQPHIIGAALNHISGHKVGVAGIYNRSSYEREVRAALALWSDHVRTIVEGGEHKVVNFPQAAADTA